MPYIHPSESGALTDLADFLAAAGGGERPTREALAPRWLALSEQVRSLHSHLTLPSPGANAPGASVAPEVLALLKWQIQQVASAWDTSFADTFTTVPFPVATAPADPSTPTPPQRTHLFSH